MKTKTLLILAGAAALAWWLWKRRAVIGVPELLRRPTPPEFADQFVPGALAPGAGRSPIFPRSSPVNSGEADAAPVSPNVDTSPAPTQWLVGA